MWLNADDRLKPGALAAVKQFASIRSDADIIYGAWDFVDAHGAYLRTMAVFPFKKMMLVHYGCYIGSTSAFLNRKTIIEKGYFLNERFKCVMDGELYYRLASDEKKFVHMPVVLADFRIHGQNISQKHLFAKGIDNMLTLQKILAESRTIRRYYGVSLFRNDHINCLVDVILFFGFKTLKFIYCLTN
jgi:hypothetical protein